MKQRHVLTGGSSEGSGMSSRIYFAIGDVHGENRKLAWLHEAILERIAFEKCPATIVHLGDYVDRGPDSRGVVERIMALEKRFAKDEEIKVVSLMGNHEQMMVDSYDVAGDIGIWWSQGGAESADSYAGGSGLGGPDWRDTIPKAHIKWLRGLPSLLFDPERRLCFVHAGIDPNRFPNCPAMIRLWTRSERFFDYNRWPAREELRNLMVIHGHTPVSFEPEEFPHRINVDTGSCFGGPLTAVMLKEGEPPEFLRAV
jgi:serine/threonine protein phosphatase 1